MHTTKGDITLKMFPDECPKTIENFATHARNGYYDGACALAHTRTPPLAWKGLAGSPSVHACGVCLPELHMRPASACMCPSCVHCVLACALDMQHKTATSCPVLGLLPSCTTRG